MRARKPKRYGSRNIGICQSLWVDNLYMTCLRQIVYKHWTNTFIKVLIYKTNAVYGLKHNSMDFRYGYTLNSVLNMYMICQAYMRFIDMSYINMVYKDTFMNVIFLWY